MTSQPTGPSGGGNNLLCYYLFNTGQGCLLAQLKMYQIWYGIFDKMVQPWPTPDEKLNYLSWRQATKATIVNH